MACGAPVVASGCDCGPREAIEHGRSGLLVPVGDVAALRRAIETMLRDHDLGRRLGAAARMRARGYGLGPSITAYSAIFAAATQPASGAPPPA